MKVTPYYCPESLKDSLSFKDNLLCLTAYVYSSQ